MPTSRICFVVEIFHPEDRGGQGRQSFELARALVAAGYPVRAVTRRHLSSSEKAEGLEGVAIRRLSPCGVHKGGGWRSLLPTLWFLMSLGFELMRTARHYDVLVVSGVKAILLPPLFVALLFGKRLFVRVDATAEIEHAITPESLHRMGLQADSRLVRAWSQARRWMLSRAEGVVALSTDVRAALLRQEIPATRIFDIPNGIDMTRCCPVSSSQQAVLRAKLGLPTGPLFAYVGRLSRAKGLPLLVSAWQAVAAQRPDAHLLLIGSGSGSFDDCEAELERMSSCPALVGRMTFTGQVENAHEYLQASDVFVSCSESEGFGLALIEAMACGLPCISTPVGVAPAVIDPGRNGLLVRIGDRDELQGALLSMLAEQATWPVLGAAARAIVAAGYSMEQVVAQYGALCKAHDATPAPATAAVPEAEASSLPVRR
jgi:glycosyltransferase involved in cell wall biosynthesis